MKLLVSFLLAGAVAASPPLHAKIESFEGIAKDFANRVHYVEKHRREYRNGQIYRSTTEYFRDGKKIAQLISRYPKGPTLPEYDFEDFALGYLDGVRFLESGDLEMYRQKGVNEEKETRTLKLEKNMVTGQGFDFFVRENIEELQQGETKQLNLVFPGRLTSYNFQITTKPADNEKFPNSLHVRLQFDNWFFRLFTPYIDVYYDREMKRLLYFEGVTNIKDESKKARKRMITYEYSAP